MDIVAGMAAGTGKMPAAPCITAAAGALLWLIGLAWPNDSRNAACRPEYAGIISAILMSAGTTALAYYVCRLFALSGWECPTAWAWHIGLGISAAAKALSCMRAGPDAAAMPRRAPGTGPGEKQRGRHKEGNGQP